MQTHPILFLYFVEVVMFLISLEHLLPGRQITRGRQNCPSVSIALAPSFRDNVFDYYRTVHSLRGNV